MVRPKQIQDVDVPRSRVVRARSPQFIPGRPSTSMVASQEVPGRPRLFKGRVLIAVCRGHFHTSDWRR